jgi:hypothetical protein
MSETYHVGGGDLEVRESGRILVVDAGPNEQELDWQRARRLADVTEACLEADALVDSSDVRAFLDRLEAHYQEHAPETEGGV